MEDTFEIDKMLLEEEMKELFDDFNYSLNDNNKTNILLNTENNDEYIEDEEANYQINSNSNDDLINQILNNKDYLNSANNSKSVHYKGKNIKIKNDTEYDSNSNNVQNVNVQNVQKNMYDEDVLFEDLDSNLQKDIILKLRTDENTNQIISEEDPDIYHLTKLQLLKSDTYKYFFKGRKRNNSIGSEADVEIELGKEEINKALEKEEELIRILLKNIIQYFEINNIKYNKNLFIMKNFKGYRLIDDPSEDLTESCGIKIISVMNNVGIFSKYIYMSLDHDKIVVSKNFKNFKKITLNKIMVKKIKLQDIIYLIEKHK